jgi:hypothetical protein
VPDAEPPYNTGRCYTSMPRRMHLFHCRDVAVALFGESSRQTHTRQLPIQTMLDLGLGLMKKRVVFFFSLSYF